MRILGFEVFCQSQHKINGCKIERLALVPMQIETNDMLDLALRIDIKTPQGNTDTFYVDLNSLRERK